MDLTYYSILSKKPDHKDGLKFLRAKYFWQEFKRMGNLEKNRGLKNDSESKQICLVSLFTKQQRAALLSNKQVSGEYVHYIYSKDI